MKIVLDPDVEKVADFLMTNVSTPKLRLVARAVSQLADLLCAEHAEAEEFRAFDFFGTHSIVTDADENCLQAQSDTISLARQPQRQA